MNQNTGISEELNVLWEKPLKYECGFNLSHFIDCRSSLGVEALYFSLLYKNQTVSNLGRGVSSSGCGEVNRSQT